MLNPSDFIWSDFFWTSSVQLEAWRGYQTRRGPYAIQDVVTPTDGFVKIVISPEGRDACPLSDSEIATAEWAIAHQAEMQQSFLAALLKYYGGLRPKLLPFLSRHGDPTSMPRVETKDGFRDLIGPSTLNIHPVQKNGLPYIGLELGCSWDIEHGLGVLFHGARVVEIGGADTAILLWIAEKDAGVFEHP